MIPFRNVSGPVACLPLDNIDTDQLIPARFMTRTRSEGYGDALLRDLRMDANGKPVPDFPLHAETGPVFLVAGANFGCGSSREAAVYALADFGIRAVLALGFGDIFHSNAMKNGLLPIVLSLTDNARAMKAGQMTIDLEAQTVTVQDGGPPLSFEVPAAARRRMLEGLDEISDTLTRLTSIEAHEAVAHRARPWLLPDISPT
ncbi:3-isopropylmalate dehydratase small subunit LeuD [Octadecabacter arcticus 238]|jgi:3-isopropylmalate/(R)-2-methylmalate dehydratase small subunit|uniref:3-isopropylmalate dehydratase n=1 Tax=Octadecabacter arcticus 238 TaxID=391616 RepID=M9RKC0_9RHOB|nr:3-isopropylmalate dehydratase small subunit [Octadecabacter arcticus]AGI72642.1 3-isopropylmalate dehydratase small subunit LeuD [Octadecabacter arcticus 238]